MKKRQLLYLIVGLFAQVCSVSASLTSITDEMMSTSFKIVLGENKVSQENLETLQINYEEAKKTDQIFFDDLDQQKKSIKEDILDVKHELQKASSDFISQKFTLLNKYDQLLLDFGDFRHKYVDTIKQHIDYIKTYINNEKPEVAVGKKSVYSFDDLHILTKKIAKQDDILSDLQQKKNDAESAINRLNGLILQYDRQLKEIKQKVSDIREQEGDIKEDIELLDLEKECASLGKNLSILQIDVNRKNIQFIEARLFVTQDKLRLLKEYLHAVRIHLRVDQSDISKYEQEYGKIKRESQVKKADSIKQRNELIIQKKNMQDDLAKLMEELNVSKSNIQQLKSWDIQGDVIQEINNSCQVANFETSLVTLEQKLDQIQVNGLLEDAKTIQAKTEFDVIGSLYLITQVSFKDNDQAESEREIYKELQASLISQLKHDKEQIAVAHGCIKSQHKALSNIKKVEEKIKLLQKRASRDDQRRITNALQTLKQAQKSFAKQNSLSVKLSELYTQVMAIHEETLGTVNFIVKEFDLVGVWHRSNRAITWKGIKLVIPNLMLFAWNVKSVIISYFSLFTISNIILYITSLEPSEIFSFLFLLLLLFVCFVLLQTLISYLHTVFQKLIVEEKSTSLRVNFLGLLFEFLQDNFFLLYGWMGLWFFSTRYRLPIALLVLLYCASVGLLIYFSRIFLLFFMEKNKKSNYFLLNQRFESRFAFIFSFFSISTATILFLRKLFMLVMMYQQSEFPTILLRLYHVVIFVSIVFSIDKEELLQQIPEKGLISQKISDFIDHYYSMILGAGLCLLIMSDPYLGGYGSLVWHMIFNTILTIFIVFLLFFVHQFIKRYSTIIFFKEDDEYGSNKERFDYAKTWYAIYVVSLFGAYLCITSFICLKVWGYGVSYRQVMDLLHYGVFRVDVLDKTGKVIQGYLRISGILRIIFTSLSGFLLAHIFNQFILKRIFAIQYIDPGVQNAVTTISRYFIISSMILIAFARADLGHMVTYILGLGIIIFGWSFKDLFTDVVAYFFILVQRPIKLGDYVQLDDNTMGVVRKISPRAVILRRKNSVTIVVPNSRVLKTALYNWNYTRSFLAFDDITFSVPFSANVVEVRDLLIKILDNHPDVLKVPESIVRLNDFGDKGYVFLVRGFLSFSNTLNQWDIRSDIRFEIIEALKGKGITVAEPILRVNMKSQKDEI